MIGMCMYEHVYFFSMYYTYIIVTSHTYFQGCKNVTRGTIQVSVYQYNLDCLY